MKAGINFRPAWSLNDPIWFVRLCVSLPRDTNVNEATVYYRCRMTYEFLMRWLWYFEYLQARIKVACPHRVVNLTIGRMDPKMRLGQEFVNYRRATLIKSRSRKLDELVNTPFDDDLFGFTSQEVNDRIRKLKSEVEALERGEITFPVLPDYVNDVKQWIQKNWQKK